MDFSPKSLAYEHYSICRAYGQVLPADPGSSSQLRPKLGRSWSSRTCAQNEHKFRLDPPAELLAILTRSSAGQVTYSQSGNKLPPRRLMQSTTSIHFDNVCIEYAPLRRLKWGVKDADFREKTLHFQRWMGGKPPFRGLKSISRTLCGGMAG